LPLPRTLAFFAASRRFGNWIYCKRIKWHKTSLSTMRAAVVGDTPEIVKN